MSKYAQGKNQTEFQMTALNSIAAKLMVSKKWQKLSCSLTEKKVGPAHTQAVMDDLQADPICYS